LQSGAGRASECAAFNFSAPEGCVKPEPFLPSAASANTPDEAVDPRVLFIQSLLKRRRRKRNIGGLRLAVADRR